MKLRSERIKEAVKTFTGGVAHPVANDPVNHPSHYTSSPAKCSCGKPIECIQVVEHMGFNLGNSVKYLWRCDLKKNDIEDLRKAEFYIKREIEKRTK